LKAALLPFSLPCLWRIAFTFRVGFASLIENRFASPLDNRFFKEHSEQLLDFEHNRSGAD
jgi:hypothetical protein